MKQQDFVNLLMPVKDKMYRFAKRMLVSHDEAEDAVQEVFTKLWDQSGRLQNLDKPEAFAMIVTKNYCLDRLKSRQASQLSLVHSNYASTVNVEKQLEYQDTAGMVFDIIEQLPEKQRMAMQLRDVEGFDYQEVAEILEMNETAVRVTLSRARKTVREELLKRQNYGIVKG